MNIYLDDAPLTETADTLAGAIAAARDRASSLERVIVDVIADGTPLAPAQLDDDEFMGSSFEEVRLTTAEPRTFVRVTMCDAADALEYAREQQKKAAEHLEAGHVEDGYKSLEQVVGTWQAARQSLDQGAQLLGLDLSTMPLARPETLSEAIEQLTTGLAEVRRCVQGQDWAGLSDVLLYDLDELVVRWQSLLREVAACIAADTKPSDTP
ncbi:MAG: hypothetical protein Q9O74_05875 [Planctomycetota bacterium]|nr:hypothetical protein [Planctomycetota bacterium]